VPPERVVSLVPSVTESLFDLGLGHTLVGITDYCLHPADKLTGLPRLGGTKNVGVAGVAALNPDLVIANREENTPADIEALQAAGIPVWLTFPKTIRDALDLLHDLVRRFNAPQQELRIVAIEKAYEWAVTAAANSESPAPRVFCPIWRDDAATPAWWMTINGDTYVSDVIAVCGGQNVFADRNRRYPLAADLDPAQASKPAPDRDTRYPRVTLDEILAAQPEVILLPSEPYAFSEADAGFWRQFPDLPAVQNDRIHLVDGSLLTWHGTRLGRALQEIPSLMIG
jgi:ABC-type Fe3+-hydroxamate transport system substrate-binding protein